jgi:hypothetical protein
MVVYEFEADLWLHEGEGGWHFVTVPDDVSDDVAARDAGRRRGFGSVRVRARIGATAWSTSIFPDATRRAFVLPVKKAVRTAEGVEAGDRVAVSLTLTEG